MYRREFLSFFAISTLFSKIPLSYAKDKQKILILIELQGANDGLNTVIPFKHSRYKNLRPNIAIKNSDILTISSDQGLHPSLKGFSYLYEDSNLKIVQNLGYPQPVLSHFRSIELWETGGDGFSKGKEGWLNNSLRKLSVRNNWDGNAIFLDKTGDVFAGGGDGFLGPHAINYKPDEIEIRDTTLPSIPENNLGLLDIVRKKRQDNKDNLDKINRKLNKRKKFNFEGGILGNQLSRICELIDADINIPVYKASIGSFDTHIEQFGRHRTLLKELDQAVFATVKKLKQIGVWEDTIIMTYSEFGRRAKENGSRGTDHGMAAPHFVIGGNISGGINGGMPNLDLLKNNDLVYSLDYRSLYDFILNKHFDINANPFVKFRSDIII